jgi:organic hydroperoxide reductase OsmC/OhrA
VSSYRVELRSVDGGPTAIASSGPHSVITDRPAAAGGRGLGFNGGQLLYAAIAGCYSNDLYREAATLGIRLTRVAVDVDGDFPARGEPSTPITVDLDVEGEGNLIALVRVVDEIAEIPNSIRGTTPVELREVRLRGPDYAETTLKWRDDSGD